MEIDNVVPGTLFPVPFPPDYNVEKAVYMESQVVSTPTIFYQGEGETC